VPRRPAPPVEPGAAGPESTSTASCFPRSSCPIAASLDLLGDKWTLIVVRDLVILGKRRFADFLGSPEGIATNVLAERLARLERLGLVERRRYREHPPRDEYHPTAKGRDLRPVLLALVRWGNRHLPGTYVPPPSLLRGPRTRRAAASKPSSRDRTKRKPKGAVR
jgi:DNA-binding HxlR family transcriptional regulator